MIGHRFSRFFGENSVAALQSVSGKIDGVECDIRFVLTSDKKIKLIVFHDDHGERLLAIQKPLKDISWEEIESASVHINPFPPSEITPDKQWMETMTVKRLPVPTLDDVLVELAAWKKINPAVTFCAEVKFENDDADTLQPFETEVLPTFVDDLIRQIKSHGLAENTIFLSYKSDVLVEISKQWKESSKLKMAFLLGDWAHPQQGSNEKMRVKSEELMKSELDKAVRIDADHVFIYANILNDWGLDLVIEECRKRNLKTIVGVAQSEPSYKRLLARPIDYIEVDHPVKAKEVK